ncbi:MAG: ferrous iron transporter B [Acidobacteria bacterium]|nr:ferrous iron transporter B [Acidobacteriota bacterium]
MSAPSPSAISEGSGIRAVILLGNPNVGKSVIFGHLTGRYVTVSNYPGTTVEVTRGTAATPSGRVGVTDTPGINTLTPQSEDERVTRDILLDEGDTVVQVGDAKNLERTLLLSLELAEAGRPFLLCLNMSDEAAERGILIDHDALARELGVDVLSTVATRRRGIDGILERAAVARASRFTVTYDARIEAAIAAIAPLLPEAAIARRSLALMFLAGDTSLAAWLGGRLDEGARSRIEAARLDLTRALPSSAARVTSETRLRTAGRLAARVTRREERAKRTLGPALSAVTMHPVWGLPFLAAVLYLMFLFVGDLGAGRAVNFLERDVFGKPLASTEISIASAGGAAEVKGEPPRERRFRLVPAGSAREGAGGRAIEVALEERAESGWSPIAGARVNAETSGEAAAISVAPEVSEGIYRVTLPPGARRVSLRNWSGHLNPALDFFMRAHAPWPLVADAVSGPYGIVTMGATYAIAIVLPIVATFFLAFSLLEDSGYLPRLAIMVNRLFRVMGLNGKAVLPMVLGLGCDTMATLTTRILETKKERMIVILLLALGVPCSAQLGVILGMLAGLSFKASVVWLGIVSGVILLVGWGASRLLPGRGSDFILEIPPLRVPAITNILTKTMARIEWYMKEAVPLFLLGTLLLFAADRSGVLGALETLVSPVVTGVLGLPRQAAQAFIIGFLRRDFGSAGLYRLAQDGLLDPIQVVVSLVTVTLFIPCVANFFMIAKERGMKVATLVAAFIFPFAVLVGGLLNVSLRFFEVSL